MYFKEYDDFTVNSLINGYANQRTPLINGQIHFSRRIASQTLIVDSLKNVQAISGPSFQRTHSHSPNDDFALFFSLISEQGDKITNIFFLLFYFKQRFFILCSTFMSFGIQIYPLDGLFMRIKVQITDTSKPPLFNLSFLSLCKKVSNLEALRVYIREALTMIDRLGHTSRISNDGQNALFGIKENLKRSVIMQTKQSKTKRHT